MVQAKRIEALFCSLASITSPTYGEREMADRLTRELTDLGFTVTEDNAPERLGQGTAGNLHGFLPGLGEPLLFCSHMDTVGPCENKRVIRDPDGRIHTDGTTTLGADDLAGVAEILEAVRSLTEDGTAHRPIEVLFTIGEEYFLRGSTVLDPGTLRAREGYVLDVDGPIGTAVLRASSGFQVIANVTGRSAHAGLAPETGVNAICIAARAISEIPQGRLDEETTANVGIIQGGSSGNIVPDSCMVEFETRSLSHEKALAQVERIRLAFQNAAQALGGTAEVEARQQLTAYHVPQDAPVVQRFAAACRSVGISPVYTASCGGSDNTRLSQYGIQSIVIAPGMHEIHSTQEWTTLEELVTMTRVVAELMQAETTSDAQRA